MLNLFDLKNKLGKRKLVIFVLVSIFLFVFSVSAKSVNAKTIDIGLINDYIHIPGRIGLGVTNPSYSLTLGGAGVGLQGTSTNILSLFTNSLERLTINANGNVGIGTTNPQFPLDVVGYIRSSQGYKFSGSTNGQFTISAGNTYFDYEGGFNFRSLPSYGSSLYLTNSGHVGIGITNPAARLTVNGNTVLGGATQITPLGGGGNLIVMTDNEGNLYSTSTSAVIPEAMPVGTSGQTIRHNGGAWVATSNLFNNGTNIGIGTTNPAMKLDVVNESAGRPAARFNDGNYNFVIGYGGNYSSPNGWHLYRNASQTYYANTSGSHRFGVGTTTLMTINPNGNVGIGTTNPLWKLHATGNLVAFNSDSTDYYVLAGVNDLVGNWRYAGIKYERDSNVAKFGSYLNNLIEVGYIAINNSGNVGIGTTNPTARLTVNGNTVLGGATQITPLGGAGNAIVMADNAGNLYSTSTSVIIPSQFWSGTLNGNIWNGSAGAGNVGIGLTNPTAKLDVFGNIKVGDGGGASLINFNSTTYGALQFGGVTRLAINGSNIGIGTTNPLYRLDVQGGAIRQQGSASIDGYLLTNSGNLASQTNLNPGILVYHGSAGSDYGMDLGYDSGVSRYRTRIFTASSQDIAFGSLNIPNFTEWVTIRNGGNVGIGNTNPNARLAVNGNTVLGGATQITPLGGAGNVLVMADNTGTLYSVASPSGSVTLPTGTSGATLRHDGTNWVSNTNLFNNGTNVGIGTTNPGTKLDVDLGVSGNVQDNGITLTRGTGYIRLTSRTTDTSAFLPAIIGKPVGNVLSGLLLRGLRTAEMADTAPSFVLQAANSTNDGAITDTQTAIAFRNWLTDLVTIKGNGNVGIGTTNPTYKLQVVGTSYLNGQITTSLSGTGNRCVYVDSSGNLLAKSVDCGTATGGDNLGNHIATQNIQLGNYWLSGDGGAEGVFVNSAGNVGIGTSIPNARLAVIGSSVLGGATQITALGGAGNAIVMADNTGNLYSTSTAAILSGQLWSGTKNGNIWNGDTGTGNVGIGKTNPAQKLDVTGVISASTGFRVNNSAGAAGTYLRSNGSNLVLSTIQASDVPTLNQNTTGSAYYLNSRDTRTVNDIPSDYGPVIKFDFKQNAVSGLSDGGSFTGVMTWRKYGNLSDFSGGPAIQLAYSDNGNLWTRLSSGSSAWGTWVRILNADSGVMLQTATPGTAQTGHMNISGTALFGGNVGIGTTNPSARLNVSGNTLLGGATQITALGGSGNAIVMTDNTGNLYATSTSAIIPEAMPVGTSGQTIRHDGSAWVANSNIFNNGTNVGVGKTNPAQKLDVSGSIQSTGDFISSASSVYLKSNSGTNTVFRGVRANTAWSDSVNAQWFQVGASSDNIAFTALSGTSAARMAFITNAFHVVTSAGSAAPVGLFDISNGSTKLFNVLNNGNVGIGITNPSARLNVSGNTLLGGATQITALGGSGNAIVMTDNTGNLYATSTSAIIPEAMPVGTSGQTIRHDGSAWVANSNIFNNGTNVGLGTATPGARLEIVDSKTHVSGSLAGTDSILRIFNSWQSDTVGKGAAITFEDNYYFSGSPVRTTRAGIKGGTELAGNNAEGFLAFYTDSSGANSLTERMRINSAGNVGIGITNPSARLNVSGSTILAGATQITPLAGAGNAVVMTDNTGTLYANAGMSYNRTAVSNVAYTAQASDYIIAYTYLSANRVLTLPATLCTAGKAFVITNETDSAYSVVVTPDSGRLISGQASISLPAFNSIPVYCNGTNWFIY